MPEFQTSPGMRDILPPESARWRRFVQVFADVAERAAWTLLARAIMNLDETVVKR